MIFQLKSKHTHAQHLLFIPQGKEKTKERKKENNESFLLVSIIDDKYVHWIDD